jgi:hypothetical protein
MPGTPPCAVERWVRRYDWAGSSSTDSRDKRLFGMIFDDRDSDGETRFSAWCAADADRKKVIFLEISEIVLQTMYVHSFFGSVLRPYFTCAQAAGVLPVRWWKAYCGSVKGQIRQVLRLHTPSTDPLQLGWAT